MKTLLGLITVIVISLSLCGCMSARAEQNPKPRTNIPCEEWGKNIKKTDTQSSTKIEKNKPINKRAEKENSALKKEAKSKIFVKPKVPSLKF